MHRGTVVSPRAHGILHAIDSANGTPLEIKYYLHLQPALTRLCEVNLRAVPADMLFSLTDTMDSSRLYALISRFRPSRAEIWTCSSRGTVTLSVLAFEDPNGSGNAAEEEEDERQLPSGIDFPICFLVRGRQVHLIQQIQPVQRCEHCARFYKHQHECSVRRRDFYFHHINSHSSNWWQEIHFFPIGSHPRTERLFITYDVETYTWMGAFGKQLVPFMLVMKLSGDDNLVKHALQLALELGWDQWEKDSTTFYCLTPEKMKVGQQFRTYRNSLQTSLATDLWMTFLQKNPHLSQWAQEENGLVALEDLSYEDLKRAPAIKGEPRFVELYIVGHNINGFDEIVLAAQVINNRLDVPGPFKISRNFIPRAGKILFNDITFALPNPHYKKRTNFLLWEHGRYL